MGGAPTVSAASDYRNASDVCRRLLEKIGGTLFTEGRHYSSVNFVLGGHYSPVNYVRGGQYSPVIVGE